jgi:HEAT repeat protein
VLVKHAENSLEELLRNLGSEDDVTRRYASEDLGELGDEAAIPALIRALEDPVIAVREAAADGLVAIGGLEVSRQVAHLMSSDNTPLRNAGLEILEAMGSDAVEVLIQCCSSPSSDIRKFALDILGKIGEVSEIHATGLLIVMLNDVNINVAGAAAEAIGRVGDSVALPALVSHLDSESWLQCNVMHAIARIGGEAAMEALGKVDVDRLSPEALHYYHMAVDLLGRK